MQFGAAMGALPNLRILLGFGSHSSEAHAPKLFHVSQYKYLDRIFA